MQLIRFDPFKNLVDDAFLPTSTNGLKIRETDKSIIVDAVVAGVPKKDVEIEIEDGVLTIKAEVKNDNASYQYYYTTALSGGQWDKAEAFVDNGVVSISIPKTESSRPRKVIVKTK